ncbi:MAG: hypothetical protein NVSMB9_32660 [Isosphaeraceae bacterium]
MPRVLLREVGNRFRGEGRIVAVLLSFSWFCLWGIFPFREAGGAFPVSALSAFATL